MSEMSTFVKPYSPLFQGFSKVTECLPHPTPKREKERGAAGPRRATLFLSLLLPPQAASLS